jgi:hypothetical protein
MSFWLEMLLVDHNWLWSKFLISIRPFGLEQGLCLPLDLIISLFEIKRLLDYVGNQNFLVDGWSLWRKLYLCLWLHLLDSVFKRSAKVEL